MKKARLTEEQIIGILQEHEAGAKCADLCRKHGMSEGTFYAWKAKYSVMTVSEAKWLKTLEGHLDGLEGPVTSEMICQMLRTNPSLVRRTMAGLRESGLVTSTKGRHGGWHLARSWTRFRSPRFMTRWGRPRCSRSGNRTMRRNACWSGRQMPPLFRRWTRRGRAFCGNCRA